MIITCILKLLLDTSQNEMKDESLKAKDQALLMSHREIETLQEQVQQLVSYSKQHRL